MKASFNDAKQIVLVAAYETLYDHAQYESYTAEEIHKLTEGLFAAGFTKRALAALVDEDFIRLETIEDGPYYYSLTDKGLIEAERLPSLAMLTARLRQAKIGESDIEVPASDRVVRLDHNQITAAEEPVAELIDALEGDNGDPDHPGLRERLLGQIKAGRELIRAGEFRAYLLYEVLVRALGELIARYKNPTIAALANALLGAVVSQLIQVS